MNRPLARMTVAASLVVGSASSAADPAAGTYDQRVRAQTLTRDESFIDPSTYRPARGGTRAVLDVKYAESYLNGVRLKHRSYNGGLVGPVIRVRRGSSLDVRLLNNLPGEPADGGHDVNTPHGFDITNLHTHGLHVSPEDPGDNVFREVPPLGRHDYHFNIRADHPAGTFWYHAHKHGSVAVQLASGMAGALIVEGGLDDAPGIREAEEKVLVLQQFTYRLIPGQAAIVHPDDIYSGFPPSPQTGSATTVNGQVTPTITMRPGEVQRWRLIHAGIEDSIVVSLNGIKLHEIAVDGLATGTRTERDSVELQPGYRSDVLVKAPALKDASAPEVYVLKTEITDPKRSLRKCVTAARDLLRVVVEGPAREMPLPDPASLKKYAAFTDKDVPTKAECVKTRALKFTLTGFLISGERFDPDHLKDPFADPVRLGTAEEWTVTGDDGGHPFHVHVNPFAVLQPADGSGKEHWVWRDTLFVPNGETATTRARFSHFPGKTVLHCHILDHEDQGMMRAFRIADGAAPGTGAGPVPGRGRAALPAPAPGWALTDPDGRPVRRDDLLGRPLMMVFHRGLGCEHCADQVGRLALRRRALDDAGLRVVAISPELPTGDDLRRVLERKGVRFPLLADPDLGVFRRFGCVDRDGGPLHGVFVVDAGGRVCWQSVGEQPEVDVDRLLDVARRSLAGARPEAP